MKIYVLNTRVWPLCSIHLKYICEPIEIRVLAKHVHILYRTNTFAIVTRHAKIIWYFCIFFFFFIIHVNDHKWFSLVTCVYFRRVLLLQRPVCCAVSCIIIALHARRMYCVYASSYYCCCCYHVCKLERFFGFLVFAKVIYINYATVTRGRFSPARHVIMKTAYYNDVLIMRN